MLTATRVRNWYRIHKWTSLICTAFLLMSCLTGFPLIFEQEISRWTDHQVRPATLPETAHYASLDRMVEEAKTRHPGERVLSIGWDDDEPRIFVDVAPNFDPKPNEDHVLIFDAHTGKLLEEPHSGRDFLYYVAILHIQLLAGLPGELLLGCVAFLFVIALVSGAVVYGPFMRKLQFGTVRRQARLRVRWFDLHNLIGIVTLTWGLVVGITGAMNTLSEPLFDLWRGQELPRLLAPYEGRPLADHLASIDAAVATTHRALPQMELTSVVFPNPKFGSPRHYIVWTRGKTPVTSRLFTPALIDAETGQLTTAKGLPWYLRTLEVSRPLHFGDYGGMPLKIIWALFDAALIVVLLSGIYLWLSRRKTAIEDELTRLVKLERLSMEEKAVEGVQSR